MDRYFQYRNQRRLWEVHCNYSLSVERVTKQGTRLFNSTPYTNIILCFILRMSLRTTEFIVSSINSNSNSFIIDQNKCQSF